MGQFKHRQERHLDELIVSLPWEVPVTIRAPTVVVAQLNTPLPVSVRLLVPPASVLLKVTLLSASIRPQTRCGTVSLYGRLLLVTALAPRSDVLVTACGNCHDAYRDVPGGVPNRCMP